MLMKSILHLIEICKKHSYEYTKFSVALFFHRQFGEKFSVTHTAPEQHQLRSRHNYMQMIIVTIHAYSTCFYHFNAMQI